MFSAQEKEQALDNLPTLTEDSLYSFDELRAGLKNFSSTLPFSPHAPHFRDPQLLSPTKRKYNLSPKTFRHFVNLPAVFLRLLLRALKREKLQAF